MPNSTRANAQTQNTIDPIFRNLAKGETPTDKLDIIDRNVFDIDTLCDLIEGFDTSISNEPVTHATALIQRLAREAYINGAGLWDYLYAIEEGNNG